MPVPLKQTSFVGGEFSPELHSRTDLQRYAFGMKTCRNWFVTPTGAIKNRAGHRLVREVADSDVRHRLVPFIFNSDQAYVLELGEGTLRIHKLGATLLTTPAGPPIEVETPWAEEDLLRLRFTQLGDVLTVTHQTYKTHHIKRYAEDDWRVEPDDLARPVNPPTDLTYVAGAVEEPGDLHPNQTWSIVVVSVDAQGHRSLPSEPLTGEYAIYSNNGFLEISWTAPTEGNAPVEYEVYRGRNGVYGYVGSSKVASFEDEARLPDYTDSPPEQRNPFEAPANDLATTQSVAFVGTDATKVTAAEAYNDQYTVRYSVTAGREASGTVAIKSRPAGGGPWTTHATKVYDGPSEIPPVQFKFSEAVVITADGLGNNAEFQVELVSGAVTVNRDTVDWVETPGSEVLYPNHATAVGYFEQRRVFAGHAQNPRQFTASRTGEFNNFDRSSPAKDDDAIELTLANGLIDEVRDLVPLRFGVVVFTAGSEWVVRGTEGAPLTPSSFDAKPFSYHGSGWVSPIRAGSAILAVSNRQTTLREFAYNQAGISDTPRDLTVLAKHLFGEDNDADEDGKTIEEMAWAPDPYGILWAVRSDGVLLGMTYSIEHDVYGWHRHDTAGGAYESVCCIPEGTETAVYVIVRRTVNGATVRTVERFATRRFSQLSEAMFLDGAVSYDGTNTTAITAKLTGGIGWEKDTEHTLTFSATPGFPIAVNSRFLLLDAAGDYVEARVTTIFFADPKKFTVVITNDCPASLQNTAVTTWKHGTRIYGGLGHLEGLTVTALVDGAETETAVVSGGSVTLSDYGYRTHIGIPIVADAAPLNLHVGDRHRTSPKVVNEVALEVQAFRGLMAGQDFEHLREVQLRTADDGWGSQRIESGVTRTHVPGRWTDTINIAIRQTAPLPATVLAVIPTVDVVEVNDARRRR